MKSNRLKQLLHDRNSACGSWVSLANPQAAEIMGLAGFDWLLIDMEHGTGDYQTLLTQVMAISGAGNTTPIVRVQSNDPVVIKRVLDTGAEGIMVPSVRTAEEARRAVASTQYAPHGIRSVAATRANLYKIDKASLAQANDNIAVFLQIETSDAVAAIDEILDVPGIDVAFIGPNDLAADLGHPGDRDHPKVQEAISKVEAAAKRRGIALGSVSRDRESAAKLLEKNYRVVSVMADTSFILTGASAQISTVKAHPNFVASSTIT